jgi:hypothetical protein
VSIAIAEAQPAAPALAAPVAPVAVPFAAALLAPAPPPASPAAPEKPREPDISLAAAQPTLSRFLQSLESGSPDRVAGGLEQEARRSSSAAAFLRQYAVIANAGRRLAISNVQLRSEPHEGHLLVTGVVFFRTNEAHTANTPLPLRLHAEFSLREGQVVMSRNGMGE